MTSSSTGTPIVSRAGSRLALARAPSPLTSLLAREREIDDVTTLLRRDDVRLLTVTGPGGVGKTRLAIAVAHEMASEVADGIAFIALAPVRDPTLIPAAIAQGLGIRDSRAQSVPAALARALSAAELLLVLDNFEHVLNSAPLLVELLSDCPRLTILVTSRAALRVSGEREYPVPPLGLPGPEASGAGSVANAPAASLFVERAAAVDPRFTLTDDNAAAVAAICARLDGLPLAIELAAARSKVLPPAQLLSRLARRLPLLTGGPRDLPARLQTMHDAIAWSHDLLRAEEQVLFGRLSVFVGGFDLDAAEVVCQGIAGVSSQATPTLLDTLDGVASLVDQSLLRWSDAGESRRRLGMLETVREFAHEQLLASGEAAVAHAAHADYFMALGELAEPGIAGPAQADWFERIEVDLPNLRAAMGWLRDQHRPEHGLRIATALRWFWFRRNREREGRQWLESFLSLPLRDDTLRAKGLSAAGTLAGRMGHHAQAQALQAQSLALSRSLDDPLGIAIALRGLGDAAMDLGDLTRAEALFDESLRLCEDLDATWDATVALNWSGIVAYARGDYAAAAERFSRALVQFEQAGDQAFANWMRGNLGWVAVVRKDFAWARAAYAESLEVAWSLGDIWWDSWCFMGIGALAAEQRMHTQAARLYGAAEALRMAAGSPLRPSVQARYDELAATSRIALGDAVWSEMFAQGQTMLLSQAVAEARDVLGADLGAGPARSGSGVAYGLTPREQEVLRLLVGGQTDREIAAALFIGHRTVQDHVSHIIAKLGATNRTEAAAVAVRDRLV